MFNLTLELRNRSGRSLMQLRKSFTSHVQISFWKRPAAAEKVILDRRVFNFNDEQYEEFINLLDAPVADDPVIEKLLARKPQWDV